MIRPSKSARPNRRFRLRPAVDHLEGLALMATAGILDPTFGGGTGATYLPIGTQTNAVQGLGGLQSVHVESDGSTVAAGAVTVNGVVTIGLVHLNADGTLDTTFGTGGVADVVLPSGDVAQPLPNISVPLLIQPGTGNIIATTNLSVGTAVAMFNPNGSPVSSFGTNGVAILNGADLPGSASVRVRRRPAGWQDRPGRGRLPLDGLPGHWHRGGRRRAAQPERLARHLVRDHRRGVGIEHSPGRLRELDGVVPGRRESRRRGHPAQRPDRRPDGVSRRAGRRPARDFRRPHPAEFQRHARHVAEPDRHPGGRRPPVFAGAPSSPVGLIIEPNGDFLALGGGKVALLNAGGSLANVAGLPSNSVTAFALLSDGDVAVVGSGGTVVARFNPNLTLDGSFGDGGIETVAVTPPGIGQPPLKLTAVAAGPDGRIVVAGANPSFTPLGGLIPPTYDVVARLTTTGTPVTSGDFTGDGVSDIALYLTQYGAFAITDSSGQTAGQIIPFGIAGPGQTIPAPGNYYGTGQEDIAAYLPTYGAYAIKDPTGKTAGIEIPFGIAGAGQTIPAPGNYYGTGQDDIAVYLHRPRRLRHPGPHRQDSQARISSSARPVPATRSPSPADYYGTGQDDIAVYLPQSAVCAIQDPTGKTSGEVIPFGKPGIGQSIPVPGDYDRSGKTELAVYIPSLAEIIYRPANGGADVTIPFGKPGIGNTLPAPGDYDGSGKTEAAVYLPSLGIFAYRPAKGGADVDKSIGVAGPGQTIPVTTVVLSPFPGSGSGSGSGKAIEVPGILGEADSLDFLILPESAAKKSKT